MSKTREREGSDLPVGAEHEEKRQPRAGRKAHDKAPPEACAIRPIAVKFLGLPVIEGEIQGTLDHVKLVAGKYHRTFPGVIEWVEVEGERI